MRVMERNIHTRYRKSPIGEDPISKISSKKITGKLTTAWGETDRRRLMILIAGREIHSQLNIITCSV